MGPSNLIGGQPNPMKRSAVKGKSHSALRLSMSEGDGNRLPMEDVSRPPKERPRHISEANLDKLLDSFTPRNCYGAKAYAAVAVTALSGEAGGNDNFKEWPGLIERRHSLAGIGKPP